MNVTFTIEGGQDGSLYDVFATSALKSSINNGIWAWMGQGYHCNTYTMPIANSATAFIILGTPLDSDGDGLTDAFELLVSHTNPNNPDTDGDGVGDGVEWVEGRNPLAGGTVTDTNNLVNFQVYTLMH